MTLRIEDIRKSISSVYAWLTLNEDLSFFKDERNSPNTENSQFLTKQLAIHSLKGRKLLNELSETVEDISIYQKNLRCAIERDKEMKRNRDKAVI